MNTNVKKCLFGGALLGAGLCSSATAGDVIWDYAISTAIASNYIMPDSEIRTLFYGDWSMNASIPSGDYAHSTGGAFGLDLAAYSTDDGYGSPSYNYSYADTHGKLSVTTDTTLLISWDGDHTRFSIREYGGDIFMDVNDYGVAGSVEFTFLAGIDYYLLANVRSNAIGNLSTFSMSETTVNVVPLPPAAFAGLGMLAGLGAYRRVRR